MTRNPRTDLNEEAQRLALLFESAGDEAQVRARPIAWQPFDGGFRFDMRTEDGWRPLRDDLLGPRRWEGGVTGVTIDYPGSDVHPSRVVFGTESDRCAGADHTVFGGGARDDRRHRQWPL